MGGRSVTEEIKLWLPLLIVSAIGLEAAIHGLGYYASEVLAVYALICFFLCLIAASSGRFFNYGWLPAYVESKRRLEGNFAIVTGANSGSGYETAKELYCRGCNVLITCRSTEKAETTMKNMKQELSKEGIDSKQCGKLDYVLMDLCSKKSVDSAIRNILTVQKYTPNILVNNAGAWLQTARITEDNIEAQWQANYLSPFYFTKKLLPAIKKKSSELAFGRIVNVASIGHMMATVEVFDAFLSDTARGDIGFWQTKQTQNVYGDTKCAQILHGKKLQELLDQEKDQQGRSVGSYLFVTSLQPGYINSGFVALETRPLVMRAVFRVLYPFFATFGMLSWKQGAQTSLHCVLSDENVKPGGYHAHCMPQETKKSADPVMSTKCDELYQVTDKLWE